MQKVVIDYRSLGAAVVLDPQWHNPGFVNPKLSDYPTSELRASVSRLRAYSHTDLLRLKDRLVEENFALKTDALIAPAVLYEAGRTDIVQINSELQSVALDAAERLNIPCYATAFLGESVTSNNDVMESTLAAIKSLQCDGWYFGFQFASERIPSDTQAIYRCLRSALLLRLTGKPVMHAYAGPMGIISFGAGCDAAASGADQTQWKFCPKRWEGKAKQSGGGPSAPRYFSPALWGTIVFPDETVQLTDELRQEIVTSSPFASIPLPQNWSESDATRHLVYSIAKGIEQVAAKPHFSECQDVADAVLERAANLHARIEDEIEIVLKDDTASYQASWRSALHAIVSDYPDDFEYLDLLN